MPRFGNVVVWSAALVAALAVTRTARAQGTPNAADAAMAACDVNENTPSSVVRAALYLGDAVNSSGDSLKRAALMKAGKALTDPLDKNASNPNGKAWEMGRVAASWLALDNQPVIVTRGYLGFLGGDSAQKVDLSVVLDSAFSIVETGLPKCVPIVKLWRMQNGFTQLMNLALNENNDAGSLPATDTAMIRMKYDSALTHAQEAARIAPFNPYPSLVFGQIDAVKGDVKGAMAAYQKGIEQTKLDTLFDPVRREIYETLGKYALDAAADTKNADDKKSYLSVAKATFTALSKEPGTSGGKIASDGLTAVAIQMGDTASIKAAYLSTLNNPDATFLELIQGGFAADEAAKAGLKEAAFDEIKLFRKANQVDPFHRDGLYNLAIVLAASDSGVSARPLVDRLLQVDPAGVLNYQLAQGVYAFVQRDAVAKANHYAELANAANKPADAAKHTAYADSSKIWDDSASYFAKVSTDFIFKKDSVYVGVEVTGWAPKDGGISMAGTMTNRSDAAKNVSMHVEFLDKAGNTVSTADLPAPIALDPKGGQNASKDFNLSGTGAGIVAFKYTLKY